MAAILANQLDFEFPPEYEIGGYLDSSRWGSFSVLSKHKDKTRASQSSYKLSELPEVLRMISSAKSQRDYWITQAVFSQFNRRKVNLASIGTAFVDIDYYKVKSYQDLDPYVMIEKVLRRCDALNIPEPSVIIDSGRGLQVKWFHCVLPKKALARWDAVQRHLVRHFEDLGGDKNSRDVSRVLRVMHTYNQKTGNRVELVYVNNQFEVDAPVKYSFNELAAAVIPEKLPTDKQILDTVDPGNDPKFEKAKVSRIEAFRRGFSLDSLNWTRLCDLQKLIEIRGGDVGEGMREPMAFYLCNFYALRYHKSLSTRPLDDWSEFRQLCLQAAPHWDAAKITDKTSNIYALTRRMAAGETVELNGVEYPPLYTPKNITLIESFEITDDELRQMATIISPDEKKRRDAKRKELTRRASGMKERSEYEGEAQAKRDRAKQMKADGFKNKEIAAAIGVHVKSVSRYLRG